MRTSRCSWSLLFLSSILVTSPVFAERPDIRWMLGGHRLAVLGAAFSPNSQLVASASDDGTVKLWQVSDGRLLRTFLQTVGGSNAGRNSVLFSPDGKFISATGTGGAHTWALNSSTPTEAICAETGFALAYSPDGQTLAVGGTRFGFDEIVCLFNADNPRTPQTFGFAEPHYVFAVAFTPDAQTVLAGTAQFFQPTQPGFIRYWRASDGVEIRTVDDQGGGVKALAVAPSGQTFASAGGNGTLKIRQLADGAVVRPLTGHTGEVRAVAYSPDSQSLASTGQDGKVIQWNAATGQIVRTINAAAANANTVDWSRDGAHLVSGDNDAFLRLWDATSGSPVRTLTQLTGAPNYLSVSADGELFALAAGWQVEIRRTLDGSLVRAIPTAIYTARVGISPGGDFVADSHGFDPAVGVRRVSDGASIATLTGHTQMVGPVVFSPDGQWLATASWHDGTARIYRTSDWQFVRAVTESGMTPLDVCFSPDSQVLATVGDGAIRLWNVADGSIVRRIPTVHNSGVAALAFSPDGGRIATASHDHTVRMFRVSDGAMLWNMPGHKVGVVSVSFSPDGTVLASGGSVSDDSLRLWRVSDGATLAVYDEEIGTGAFVVSFVPQSGHFVYLRNDATVVRAANPFVPDIGGDINGDGLLNPLDTVAFVNVLLGSPVHPDHVEASDLNSDSLSDGLDIAPFLMAITGR